MHPTRLRIFISSPGDVGEERVVANKLVLQFADEFADRLLIEPVYWEHEPLQATDAFQSSIPPASTCQVFLCILWSRLGSPLPPRFARPDGSRYASGTEYEYEVAFESQKQSGSPEMYVYRKTAECREDISNKSRVMERMAQKEALDRFLAKWLRDESDGADLASATFETSAQFEQLLEAQLRKVIERRLPQAPPGERPAKLSWKKGSPFRGLEVFDFNHTAVYCGRSKAVSEVLTALRKQASEGRAFALVLGASGGGKSSLVRSGVLPRLVQRGVIEGVQAWRRAVITPGSAKGDLFTALATGLVQENALPELKADGTSTAELARQLADPAAVLPLVKGGLSQVAALLASERRLEAQGDVRLALVVDQLEEIFTASEMTAEHRQAFIKGLAALARSGRVWVLATLRSDFYHRCSELEELVALMAGAGQYNLLSPTSEEIHQMIKQPARAAGLWFEQDEFFNDLDKALEADAAGNPDSMPLLEFALEELYKRRTSHGALTWQAYRELGGLKGALANKAEDVFSPLPAEVQAVLPEVFFQLVAVNDKDATVTGKQAPIEAFSAPACRSFVDAFVAARLFTTDLAADGQHGTVRVAHEALLKNWPRLTKWLNQDLIGLLRIRDRVEVSAHRWQREQRPSDLLLPEGKPLQEAQPLLKAFPNESDLSSTIRDFIRESERRAANWSLVKRSAVVVLALLTVVAGLAAGVAFWQRNVARVQQQLAAKNEKEAQRQLAEGLVSQGVSLGLLARHRHARDSLVRAYALFQELDLSPRSANLVLWNLLLNSPSELMTVAVHDGSVNCVCLSPDGRSALSGSGDHDLKLWNAVTGNVIKTLSGHTLPVGAICFSPDGQRALSGGADNDVRLWDIDAGKTLKVFKGHKLAVKSVCLSGDGRRALSGGADNTVRLWDVDSGAELAMMSEHTDVVDSVALSPDGRYALSGSADNTLKLWDLNGEAEVKTLTGHTSPVMRVAFSAGGRTALSASWDHTLKLWDLETAKAINTLSQDNVFIKSAAFAADGRTAITADGEITAITESQPDASDSPDARLTLWDLERGQAVKTFPAYTDSVTAVALSADGTIAVSGSSDKTSKLWHFVDAGGRRTFPDKERRTFHGHAAGVTSIAFSPDGLTALSGSADKTMKLWDLATGQPMWTFTGHKLQVTSVAFSHDGRTALSGSWDRTVKSWDIASGKLLASLPREGDSGHVDLVSGVAFFPDDRTVLSGSEDRLLKVWELATGKTLATWSGHTSGVTSVAISRDGRTALSGSTDTELKQWNVADGRNLQTFVGHTSTVCSVAFSPSGRTALSSSADHRIKLWDLDDGRELLTLAGHGDSVTSVVFSIDGSTALSGSADHTLKLWDLETGKELRSMTGHNSGVTSVALSPESQAALSGSWDKTLKLWDFDRPSRYIEFGRALPEIQAGLRRSPQDPASLDALAQWYAFRGMDPWAVELFEQARAGGAEVSSLALARCYWNLDRRDKARQELAKALERAEAPADYLQMCMQVVEKSPPPAPLHAEK